MSRHIRSGGGWLLLVLPGLAWAQQPPFGLVPTDGGFYGPGHALLETSRRRELDVFVPARADGVIVVSDSAAADSTVTLQLENATFAVGQVVDGGAVRFEKAHSDIDLEMRGVDGRIELIFTPAPFAPPPAFGLRFGGPLMATAPQFDGGFELSRASGDPAIRITLGPPACCPPVVTWDGTSLRIASTAQYLSVKLVIELAVWRVVPVDSRSPGSRRGHGFVLDPVRARHVVFGGSPSNGAVLGDTWSWDGDRWTQLDPPASPRPRWRHAMAWDAARRRIVLFGGATESGPTDETWEFDGATWLERQFPTAPPARWQHGLVWDERRQRLVLFGGLSRAGAQLGDTWEYDGTAWTLATPAVSPTPRDALALGWDGVNQKALLFGGWDGGDALADTWSWDGSEWVQLMPGRSPPRRSSSAMAWDSSRQRLVLHGGFDWETLLGDTWEWDGTEWLPQLEAVGPGQRARQGMAAGVDGGVLLSAGQYGHDDLWQRGTGGWTRVPDVPGYGGALAWDPASRVVQLRRTTSGGAWAWVGDRWERVDEQPAPSAIVAASVDRSTGRMLALRKPGGGVTETWTLDRGQWTRLNASSIAATELLWDPSAGRTLAWGGGTWEWSAGDWRHLDGRSFWHVIPSGDGQSTFALEASAPVLDLIQVIGLWRLLPSGWRSEPLPPGIPRLAFRTVTARDPFRETVLFLPGWGSSTALGAELAGSAWRADSPVTPTGWTGLAFDEERRRFVARGAAGPTTWELRLGRPRGASCNDARQCESGFCADGVCCDDACGGGLGADCAACSVAAGAAVDGACGPMRADVSHACDADPAECFLPSACLPGDRTCPAPAPGTQCLVDGGAGGEDGGSGEDGGVGPPDPPRGCGCDATPGLALLAIAAAAVRRRRRAGIDRP